MSKRVLDVGNCVPDHAAIRGMLQRAFNADVVQAQGLGDTLQRLRQEDFDLVLVNRKLDHDYSDGLEIIRQIKADERLSHVPCMLVTNHAEHQQEAVAAGAAYGFGKKELSSPAARERLAKFLAAEP